MRTPRTGYTLVETIVAVGVLALLAGLLLPAVQSSRDAVARAACQNHLRQVGVALQGYHASHGHFPSAGSLNPPAGAAAAADNMLNWMALVLPDIEQSPLWGVSVSACRTEPRLYQSPPHVGFQTVVKLYTCPADARLTVAVTAPKSGAVAMTSYIGSGGTFSGAIPGRPAAAVAAFPGIFDASRSARISDITDGTSQTIIVGERPPPDTFQAGQWYQSVWVVERFGGPDGVMYDGGPVVGGDRCWSGSFGPGRLSNPCDRLHYWSLHRGGGNFAFADGSVRFLPYSARDVLPALLTRAGGETAELP